MASHKHRTQHWASDKKKSGQGFAPDGPLPVPGGLTSAAAQPPPVSTFVNPFLTPDDLQAINAFDTNDATSRANITRGLADLTTNTNFQVGQLNKNAVQNTSDTQDNAAARGIFQSSIKDGNVYDIEAQRRINVGLLNDRLTTAQTDAATQLGILDTSKANFDTAMAGKQVENAQSIPPTIGGTSAPKAASPGTAAPGAAPTSGAPAAPTSPIAATGQPGVKTAWGQPMYPTSAAQPTTGKRHFPRKPKAPKWTGQVKAG